MAIDYTKNKKYFQKPKLRFPIALGVIGLIVAAFSGDSTGALVFGLLLLVASAGLIYKQVGGRPSDKDFDEQSSQALIGIKERAMEKLGIDPDDLQYVEPVLIHGNLFNRSLAKRGKDNQIRTSNHTATVLFFTENQIHSYRRDFSLTDAKRAHHNPGCRRGLNPPDSSSDRAM